MAADDFFLEAEKTDDDFLFLAPKRPGSTVTPLIDGVETFRSMEQAVANARNCVHLAAWILNPGPQMPLGAKREVKRILNGRGAKSGVSTWSELLSTVAGLNVDVRVLITDFDPVLQNKLHRAGWSAYRLLRSDAKQRAKGYLQAMCSLHDAQNSIAAKSIEQSRLSNLLAVLNKDVKAGLQWLADVPRLWPFVVFDKNARKFVQAPAPPWLLHPASHHQKICIVDGAIGFCGGLDIQYGRFDTKLHGTCWHDTHCKIDGPLAADLDRNFIGRWNREMPIFNDFVATANSGTRKLSADQVTKITWQNPVVPGSGPAVGQLIRTISENALVSTVPNNLREDIKNVYQKAIALANRFVYIENQYIRDMRLADWLIARAKEAQNLVVVILLPIAPEEVAQAGGADPVTLKGLFLQHSVLTRLKNELGSRFGMYSMLASLTAKNQKDNSIWAGSPQVYVHSKTMIVDDIWATIGSANLNERSFEVDTEANIHWYDPTSVRQLRLDLWNEMLGSPGGLEAWDPSQFVDKWNSIAAANLTAKPRERKGFVVVHDPDNPHVQGQDDSMIPNAFAELGDIEPENEYIV